MAMASPFPSTSRLSPALDWVWLGAPGETGLVLPGAGGLPDEAVAIVAALVGTEDTGSIPLALLLSTGCGITVKVSTSVAA